MKVNNINNRPLVLTIAGFDPCSGAGLTADIKTFEAHKVYGLAVQTGNTVQNHENFAGLHWTEKKLMMAQLRILMESYDFSIVKIGIIEDLDILLQIVEELRLFNPEIFIIWDPVIKASAGFRLHNQINKVSLNDVLHRIDLLTPNTEEAKIIFEFPVEQEDLVSEIQEKINMDHCKVLLKGGHNCGHQSTDYLISRSKVEEFSVDRSQNQGVHGSGCILSSAIAAQLALDEKLEDACQKGQSYISDTINYNNQALAIHNKDA
jgi:hydroxymethylpyrimidine kinase/phosphomethylpyrimidine kinase